jgi:hypothetical protein
VQSDKIRVQPHKIGTPYDPDQPAFMVKGDIFRHGINAYPVINPNRILPYIYQECPALEETMLVVDSLRHKNVREAMREAPDALRAKIQASFDNNLMSEKEINHQLKSGNAYAFALHFDEQKLTCGVVLPFLFGKHMLSPEVLKASHLNFHGQIERPSDDSLIAQSAIALAHETGHLVQPARNEFYPSLGAIKHDINLSDATTALKNQPQEDQWETLYAAEIYADAFAAKVVANALLPRDFVAGATMALDSRTLKTMADLVTTPRDDMPMTRYVNSLVWHDAIHDVGHPDQHAKSVLHRVKDAAISLTEMDEVMALYQGLYLDQKCQNPNQIIQILGEQGQHAKTRFGAVLARDYISALDRHLPMGSIDPNIMAIAMDKISQSPGGQKYFADYPDPGAAGYAACFRIRRQEQQTLSQAPTVAPPPARRMGTGGA